VDGRRQDRDIFVAGGDEELLNRIGCGGWQLASMIARVAGIWPNEG
jgi:hypothetical protein